MADVLTVLQRETLNTVIMRRCPYQLDHRDGDIAVALLSLAARGLVRFDRHGTVAVTDRMDTRNGG